MTLTRRHRSRRFVKSTRSLELIALGVGVALYFGTFVASPIVSAGLLSMAAGGLAVFASRPRVRTGRFPTRDAALAALGAAIVVSTINLPLETSRWLVSVLVLLGVLRLVSRTVSYVLVAATLVGWLFHGWGETESLVAAFVGAAGALGFHLIAPRRVGDDTSDRRVTADVDASLLRRAKLNATAPTLAEERMARDASRAVRQSLQRTLAMLRASLRGQSAIALWIDSRAGVTRIQCAETSVDGLSEGPFSDRSGLLGVLHKRNGAVALNELDEVPGFLPWYPQSRAPRHVIGCALFDEGLLVGYLVVDRADGQPTFDDVDAIALEAAAEQVVASVHTERLVVDASRSRYEMGVLYRAADALNAALNVEDVCRVARDQLTHIAPMDLMAVTRLDADGGQRIIFADGYGAEELTEHEFDDDKSMASLAVRRAQVLPYSGRLDRPDTDIFGTRIRLPELRSLLVFPLIIGPRCVGTLTMGSLDRGAYDTHQRDHLRVITSYVGAALGNAFAYSEAVIRATTDGMTGLTNHRTFKERAREALARAERSQRPVSLIITDIDHFKKVNDTYGHQTGDEVIIAVANVLKDTLRKVDLGARYGGEEFAILLEETTTDAAVALAERIRNEVKALGFDHEIRRFGVTLSLGVATYPRDGDHLQELVERADQCLYAAKRSGRDQVRRADLVPKPLPAQASAA